MYRKTAVLLALMIVMTLASCSDSSKDGLTTSSAPTSSAAGKAPSDVRIRAYSFPEFLENAPAADVLSNSVYKSFDASALFVEPKVQPFKGYKCTARFDKGVYIYKTGNEYGVLSSKGKQLLAPDGNKRITAVSKNILQVSRGDSVHYYKVSDDELSEFYPEKISPDSVTFEPVSDGGKDYYILNFDGAQVSDIHWADCERVDPKKLDTSRNFDLIYSAKSADDADKSYYIAFDRMLNVHIFEAAYASVELKIGNKKGSCYVCDSEDFKELKTLLSSFGSKSDAAEPKGKADSDYIQITLGLEGNEKTVKTLSPDGWCFTEDFSKKGGKYFTAMSEETFADLVTWVDKTLADDNK